MTAQEILFRKTSAIPSPSFGVFSLYKYPAKFIPKIPAFVLENYAKKGMRVFDPFAGSAAVGYAARLYGLDYELWDLNPLLEHLHPLCEIKPKALDKGLIEKSRLTRRSFCPSGKISQTGIQRSLFCFCLKLGVFTTTPQTSAPKGFCLCHFPSLPNTFPMQTKNFTNVRLCPLDK
jgi:hypothetical protein